MIVEYATEHDSNTKDPISGVWEFLVLEGILGGSGFRGGVLGYPGSGLTVVKV